MEDQTAAVSTIQQTESPHSEIAVHADSLKLQNRLEQTGETEDTGRTEETGQSKQTAKMNREEEIPDQKEHLSGKEMTALASSGYTGTVESSAGTAAKPAAVDTGPADRLATAQDTLTEDLGNYLDTKISEKKGKLELSLEPERLGKLTIRLEYEKGKTEGTIFSTSAKKQGIWRRSWKKKQELLLLFTHRNRLKTGKTWIRIPVMAETAGRIKKSSARSRMTALPNS